MNSKFIGGILLIIGTSVGGGMLVLPVANAAVGFWLSSLFLVLCWGLMTLGALFILETNLYLPVSNHMVSMANATLGTPGLLITWLSYLFLLYTLLAAYISGGADVLGQLIHQLGITLTPWQASSLFTLVFGAVVYAGIRRVDLLNRSLMFAKLGIYLLLIFLIAPHMQKDYFNNSHESYMTSSIMTLITSFGFAIIVPNLREYFNDDIKTLKRVILIGSLLPLICYLAWNALIIGSLPSGGVEGLESLIDSEHTTSNLATLLANTLNNKTITSLFNFFTSLCMLTAFLGVALCLMSFLADGFKIEQRGGYRFGLFILTFIPPLLLVMYYPGAYLYALNYAGIFCVILLLLLPALMTWYGRQKFTSSYLVPGGKPVQIMVIIIALLLLLLAITQLRFS